jgi:hypothetical protein
MTLLPPIHLDAYVTARVREKTISSLYRLLSVWKKRERRNFDLFNRGLPMISLVQKSVLNSLDTLSITSRLWEVGPGSGIDRKSYGGDFGGAETKGARDRPARRRNTLQNGLWSSITSLF